jgi:predicted dehydrogenase
MIGKVGVAFVGAGWWSSSVHAPAVQAAPDAYVQSVSDPDAARRAEFARMFDVEEQFPDHRAMLATTRPDCVVIATPHHTHGQVARDCLTSDVPVLVEKPFTLDPEEAWELVRIASERRLPLEVGLTYTFHPQVAAVGEVLAKGRLGRLVSVAGAFYSQVLHMFEGQPAAYAAQGRYRASAPLAATYSNPRVSGGGQGQTQLSHLVGLLLAELPTTMSGVHAQMTWLKPGIDIAVAASMRTDDGVAVSLSSSGALRHPDERVTSLRYDGTDGWLVHDALHGIITGSADVLDGIDIPPAGEPYRTEQPVLSLLEAVRGTRSGSANSSAFIGAKTVDVVSACYQSAAPDVALRRTT